MSNAAKLRKKAAEFEAVKQIDRAIASYAAAIQESESEGEDVDVAILNKVGDLTLRQGRVADAVTYYERAVEHYATAGLFNNAIALCNKILRSAPGRSNVYFTLGRICARKGLRGDATRNFLEYATRMQQEGRVDEGMRALAEVADLAPELTEVRRLVDEHAARAGITLPRRRTPLETPAQPDEAARAGVHSKSPDLVFLQVEYDAREPQEGSGPLPFAAAPTPAAAQPAAPAPTAPTAPMAPVDSLRDVLLFDPASAPEDDFALDVGSPAHESSTPVVPQASATRPDAPTVAPGADALPVEATSMATRDSDADRAVAPVDGLVSSGDYVDVPVARLEGFTSDDAGADVASPGDQDGTSQPSVESPAPDADSAAGHADAPEMRASDELTWILPPGEDLGGEPELSPAAIDDAPTPGLTAAPLDAATPPLPDLMAEEFGIATADPRLKGGPGARGSRVRATPLAVEPIPELERAIAAGAEAAARGEASAPTVGDARLQFRLDPHDFILPGELPPLLVDDELLSPRQAGARPRVEGIPDTPEPSGAGTLADDLAPVAAASSRSTPSVPIASVAAAANSVAHSRRDSLRAAVGETPHDWLLRRRLAEALFEAGERDAGLAELETAASGLLEQGDVAGAAELADELVKVAGDRVPFHQRRVELAVRLQNQQRLRSAYLDLADALVGSGDEGRARAVYARVLEIDPADDRARAALGSAAPPLPATPPAAERTDEQYVDLADWLKDDGGDTPTRMRMREPAVSGDEQADFDALLKHFKEGVARSLADEDYDTHYDLGVAYKEMGLLEDAIAEFQKALRSRAHRLPAYEALGQCFVEQRRYQVAATVLSRALHEPGLTDEHRVGVLYLLAFSSEALERWSEARSYYQRVYATDINFRDVAARLAALEQVAR